MLGGHSHLLALQGKPEPNQVGFSFLLTQQPVHKLPAPNGVFPQGGARGHRGLGKDHGCLHGAFYSVRSWYDLRAPEGL